MIVHVLNLARKKSLRCAEIRRLKATRLKHCIAWMSSGEQKHCGRFVEVRLTVSSIIKLVETEKN